MKTNILCAKSLCFAFTTFIFLLVSIQSKSQSFSNNQTYAIPDNGSISIPVNVVGLQNTIDTSSFGLESIHLDIIHKQDKQLKLELRSPDGRTILLAQDQLGANYHTTFDAVADTFIDIHFPKEGFVYKGDYTGNYRPKMDLALLNNGQDPNGTWQLIVTDDKLNIKGKVKGVTLNFSNNPAKPLLRYSNLPIIKVYTNGQEIVDDPKIVADMFIINNGPNQINDVNQTVYNYQGKIGIEIRGNSSQTLPKLQYGLETRDASGINSVDVSLLGFPKGSDWIFSAVMTDKSLMRNVLTYSIWRQFGRYASRTKFVELVINDEYRGVFVFQEKIKKDANRVPVEKIASTDITPPNVTGGYIFSVDGIDTPAVTWQTRIRPKFKPFQFVYPKAENVVPEQLAYLQNYTDSFEAALHANNFRYPQTDLNWRNFANDTSFIDYFLLSEISKNLDSYRFSTYFYKKRNGPIYAGPAWDFDRAWRNDGHCSMDATEGYVYTLADGCAGDGGNRNVPWWWSRLLQDVTYHNDMICRYNLLRQTTLSEANLFRVVDSAAAVLDSGGQQRNFQRWRIQGKWIDNNPYPLTSSFAEEVATIKTWISARLSWLDNNLGVCTPPTPANLIVNNRQPADVKTTVYPSPFTNQLTVTVNVPEAQTLYVKLIAANGMVPYAKSYYFTKGMHTIQIDNVASLAKGMYFIKLTGNSVSTFKKVIKQ